MTDTATEAFELPASAGVGRVALRVGSLDRVAPFYRDVVGFDVDRDADGERARLTAGGETLIILEADADAPERGDDEAGLFHLAVRVPDRAALSEALSRVRRGDAALTGASDHLVSEALYLRDPAGNGVEVYYDRPREEWPWTDDGGVAMETLPLDLDDLSAASDADGSAGLPAGTDVGHVHLEVTDLPRAESFYVDALGTNLRARYGDDAAFVAAGDYHHHVGLNTWNGRRAPAGESRGLAWFEVSLPDAETLDAVRRRLEERGYDVAGDASSDGPAVAVADPDGIRVRLVVEE